MNLHPWKEINYKQSNDNKEYNRLILSSVSNKKAIAIILIQKAPFKANNNYFPILVPTLPPAFQMRPAPFNHLVRELAQKCKQLIIYTKEPDKI